MAASTRSARLSKIFPGPPQLHDELNGSTGAQEGLYSMQSVVGRERERGGEGRAGRDVSRG